MAVTKVVTVTQFVALTNPTDVATVIVTVDDTTATGAEKVEVQSLTRGNIALTKALVDGLASLTTAMIVDARQGIVPG